MVRSDNHEEHEAQGLTNGRNAWMGDMANANEVLGLLHAFYGLGGMLSPLIATTLITKVGWKWYEYYYLMIGAASIELGTCLLAFWEATGKAFQAQHPPALPAEPSSPPALIHGEQPRREFLQKKFRSAKHGNRTVEAISSKITWLCAFFLLIYVGVEVALGGWIVTFMLRVRKGSNFASGLVSTGFWLGITVGRLSLGFMTARVFKSERDAVATYIGISMALELILWLVPRFVVSAVAASLLGFFLGPLFPAAVVAATKLLPKHLHVAAIGFAAALGACGACLLPFAVGAIAQARGVQVLQPIVLAMLASAMGVWIIIPKLPKVRMA